MQSWCRTYQKAPERQYRGECKEALASRGKWLAWDQSASRHQSTKNVRMCRRKSDKGNRRHEIWSDASVHKPSPTRSQEYWTMQELRSVGNLYSVEPEVPASNWLFVSQDYQHGMLYIRMHKTSHQKGPQLLCWSN